ncbi:E1A 229R [Porcine adenovirus 3]|uniref:E1A 229R n=1 Tax=Porcine adenovirus A serotype 3 TaxID=35265 RepID=A0A9W4EBJ5_ADEP3|nr:E1A 229R [Porcine adenovirus 3]CAB41021.1 E1A 229R [Porcine adenovirus 3]
MANRLHLDWDGNPEVVPVLEWDPVDLRDPSPGDEGFCEPCWESLVDGLPDEWLDSVDEVEVIVTEGGESEDSGGSAAGDSGGSQGVFEMDPPEEGDSNEEDISAVAAEVLSELADVVFEDPLAPPSPFVLDCPEVPGVNCRSCDYHRFHSKDPNLKCSLCYMRMHAFAVYGECFWTFVGLCGKKGKSACKKSHVLFPIFCLFRSCFSSTSQVGFPGTWRPARTQEEVLL